MTGTIARLVYPESIGFIRGADDLSYFFHAAAVRGTTFDELSEGQAVTFTLTRRTPPRGPKCSSVIVSTVPSR